MAWGQRARTGLCACTDTGEVLGSASVVNDDDIVAWISEYDDGDLILAVDAPVVVPNAAGSRWCEKMMTGVFGSFHAGAYPSNTSMAAFANGPRAARLAERLGATVDLDAAPQANGRRVIEVYPHAAMVVQFQLERILPYKSRKGRDLASRRHAFNRLTDLMESMATADPPLRAAPSPRWAELLTVVALATNQAGLDRVEDELDAYMCAYVGLLYWWMGIGERCAVMGDATTGFIVTPMSAPHAERLNGWRATHAMMRT